MGFHKHRAQYNCLNARVIAGLVIIGIGILFFLKNIGLMGDIKLWKYWPTILVIIGLVHIFSPKQYRRIWHGLMFISIGVVLLLKHHGVISLNWANMWPIILVIVGGGILFSSISGGRSSPKSRKFDNDLDSIDIHAIMGGGEYKIASQNFKGGRITAIMGGCELNLRPADLTGEVEINVFAMWGGISLRVPEDWQVVIRGTPILGGIEDQTHFIDDNSIVEEEGTKRKRKQLLITGVAIMGGVEVKN